MAFLYKCYDFVLQRVGKVDAPENEASVPGCHFLGMHGIEDFGEFFYFLGCIVMGLATSKTVQLLIVEIFDFFDRCFHQAFLLAFGIIAIAGVAGNSFLNR